jgi:hypothetical protein
MVNDYMVYTAYHYMLNDYTWHKIPRQIVRGYMVRRLIMIRLIITR